MEIERGEACRLCSLREKEEDEQCSFAREASDYIWTVSVLRQLKLQLLLQLHPILVPLNPTHPNLLRVNPASVPVESAGILHQAAG